MTTLHSTTLLNEPAPAAPRAPHHVRSVTHVVPQQVPMPMYAQPQVVTGSPRGGGAAGAVSAVVLGLVVVLLGAVALVGAYAAARQSAPTAREAALTQGLAQRDAFRAGRERGVVAGRDHAVENAGTTTALRVAAAREQAYAAAFRRGERAGRSSYRAPRYTGGGGYYRAPRYRGGGSAGVYQAFGAAQALANATGAAVDVEIY